MDVISETVIFCHPAYMLFMAGVSCIYYYSVISIILSGLSVLIFEKKITLTSNNAQPTKVISHLILV